MNLSNPTQPPDMNDTEYCPPACADCPDRKGCPNRIGGDDDED